MFEFLNRQSLFFILLSVPLAVVLFIVFLGGEWQDASAFLTVRQYDAHAWVEIWQHGQWQRVADYCQQLGRQYPKAALQLHEFATLYNQLKYQPVTNNRADMLRRKALLKQLRQLRQAVIR